MSKFSLNKFYNSESFKQKFKNVFKREECQFDGAQLFTSPFPCMVLNNFVNEEAPDYTLNDIENELKKLKMTRKNNDLYKLSQSQSFNKIHSTNLIAFRDFFVSSVIPWMKEITGIPLSDTIDMTHSSYKCGDVLLCHDDALEGRRIAFIYYLVPSDWSSNDGGSLDLIASNELFQPTHVERSITPVRNSFAFFEVSPGSFHQVCEVLRKKDARISINGWFHGPTIKRPELPAIPDPEFLRPSDIEESLIYKWVSPNYLDMSTQDEIRQIFIDSSEVELTDFLNTPAFDDLQKCLQNTDISWKREGILNIRQTDEIILDSAPSLVSEVYRLFSSEAFALIMADLTGLSLHSLARSYSDDEINSAADSPLEKRAKLDKDDCEVNKIGTYCGLAWRRWRSGCYTLLKDDISCQTKCALNARYFVLTDSSQWHGKRNGGYTSFIAKGENEELLSVMPKNNSLALVYMDTDTLTFIKYVNHMNESCFYDLNVLYYEFES